MVNFLLLLIFSCSTSLLAGTTSIRIDLNKPSGTARGQGNGFLHSLTSSEPPRAFVDPLKIKFWRGACLLNEQLYARLKHSGATIQYVLSDGFQHPAIDGDCQRQEDIKDRWPHKFPKLWQKHVASEARRILANGWDVVWEPWNEPDFWENSSEHAFQQYLDAFLVVTFLRIHCISSRSLI